jgi:hypothetical protein
MVRKVVRWTLGAVNEQNEYPLLYSAELPVMPTAKAWR